MHISARTRRAEILVAALLLPIILLTADTRLDSLPRFIGVLTVALLATLTVAAVVSMAIDFGLHHRARRHLADVTFGRVRKPPTSVRCSICGRSEVQVGDLHVCPTCDHVD